MIMSVMMSLNDDKTYYMLFLNRKYILKMQTLVKKYKWIIDRFSNTKIAASLLELVNAKFWVLSWEP